MIKRTESDETSREVGAFIKFIEDGHVDGDLIMPPQSEEFDLMEYIKRITKE